VRAEAPEGPFARRPKRVEQIVHRNQPGGPAAENAVRREWIETRRDDDPSRADGPWYQCLFFGRANAPLASNQAASEAWRSRTRASRALHRGREAATHAGAGAVAAAWLALWLVLGFVYAFPHWWETVLYTVTSSVTLLLVFALQHTQARQEAATQRKLDEILRSLPDADNRLIAAEEAADEELAALGELNRDDRARARGT
jgi:low affinity Fe/Cu permease